jgi:hypothetical protein
MTVMVWIASAVALAIFIYWIYAGNRGGAYKKRPSRTVIILVVLALGLTVWSEQVGRPQYSYSLNENPLAIAIAFDLSPSMLAIPDPAVQPGARPRFERAIAVIQELFSRMEDRRQDVLVTIIGFTKTAEVIMGWESNPAQVREILHYIVSPELFTNSGTSIEAATKALIGAFDTLPSDLKEKSQKVGILVSDGEDTLPFSYLEFVLEELESAPFDIISLQAGLIGVDEGVPEYGEFGEFITFKQMGGKFFTVPNVETMTQIAEVPNHRSLYVRAETPQESVTRMLDFIGRARAEGATLDARIGVVLALFLIVAALYAQLVR